MNIYSLYENPLKLIYNNIADKFIPILIWEKYEYNLDELERKERFLAKDAKCVFLYALKIKKPFPLGEEVISKNAHFAFLYAKEILNNVFPLGEAIISRCPYYALWYAKYVINGPFLIGEAAIAKDKSCAYEYANKILKGPFPAGEKIIATDARYAINYAMELLKGPFLMGESIIKKYPYYNYLYENMIKRKTIDLIDYDNYSHPIIIKVSL